MPDRRIGLLAGAAATAAPAIAHAQNYGHGHGDWGWGWGWGHMLFGGVTMLLFWGVIIALVVFLVRALGAVHVPHHQGPPRDRSSARDILDERFARGEIDHEEYEKRRRALEQ